MILTSQDIQAQKFHVRFRGFDVEEVDGFLEQAAASFQALTEENQQLKSRLKGMEQELSYYQDQQKNFQNAIVTAQNVAEGMKEKSRQEAGAIVAAAHEEARLRGQAADLEIKGLNEKIERLRALREETRDNLRRQLHVYLEVIEEDRKDAENDAPGPGKNQNPPDRPIIVTASSPRDNKETAGGRDDTVLRSPATKEETGCDDLYEKIDLPEIPLPGQLGPLEEGEPAGLLNPTANGGDDQALPDLDGEMIFDLDDPLASQEPELSFSETLELENQKKSLRLKAARPSL